MKYYGVRFGSGDPRTLTGLSPTFLFFVNMTTGATITPPAITETYVGTGIYNFNYGVTTPISFLIDAATTSPGPTGRYVSGQIDPADRGDEYAATLIAIGTSLTATGVSSIAIGTSLTAQGSTLFALGTTGVALGTSITAQAVTLTALSTSILAQGVTTLAGITLAAAGIGSTASSFGTALADPVDLFGYLKRIQENLEGNNTYAKVSGAFTILSRGSSTTLATKTISNSVSLVTKI